MDAVEPISGVAVPITLPPAVARIRRRWDLAASLGARSHVTVLYPFLATSTLTSAARAGLAAVAAATEPFDVRFSRARRFEGLLWIEPEPAAPFQALTASIVARWPDHPPYGGLFDTVIPHLTLAESAVAPLEALEQVVAGQLPFVARARALECWGQDERGRWRPRWRIPLGARP